MANLSGSRCEMKNIKKVCAKESKKHESSISDSSISDYYSSLCRNSEQDKKNHPADRKETKRLDNIGTNKIKNKYQCNYAIKYEPKFDDKCSLSSGTNKEPCQ